MEELSNKLNSASPVVISQIISKLIDNLKENPNISESIEFQFLKDKCVSENNAVSVVASNAILKIIRGDPSLVKPTITDFVTIVTTTRCSSNIIYLMNNLLMTDLQQELSKSSAYKSTLNLRLPQHPFVTLLNENAESWSTMFREITFSYGTSQDISHCNELYKPVFLYVLCNPKPADFVAFRQKLWSFIVQCEPQNPLIYSFLKWMHFEDRNLIQMNGEFLMELSNERNLDSNVIILWNVSVLHQLLLQGFDPREMIHNVINLIEDEDDWIVLNPVLIILAKTISFCSSAYLLPLFQLCKTVLFRAKCDIITGNILRSSLLQWMANPSILTSDAVSLANCLFTYLENNETGRSHQEGFSEFLEKFGALINTNTEAYLSIQLRIVMDSWNSNADVIQWLRQLQKAPTFFTNKIVDVLLGLVITEFHENAINSIAFDLIQRCVEYNKTLASNVLTVILYKLTNTTDSKLHYQLLKAIPKMAVVKDNLQKVVGTIQALSKGPGTLRTFSTTLMLDVWKIDNKCYPYLESLLISPVISQGSKWEFYITRAHALKELCALKPELYGKDMVAHLSKILNECNNAEGAIASALAIEGITLLCKTEIIDAVTTWATLAPMFKNETRIPVIKSVCSLISEVPSLSYTEAYPKLTEEVVEKLWEYIVVNQDDEVWSAALNSLSHFSLEHIVAQIPEHYMSEELLEMKKGGHVIPGNCWIEFLKNCTASKLTIAGDFLIKMVSLEISGYLKFVYQVKGTREPVDYSYLPANSVVRGISTYIKSKILKWKCDPYEEVYLQCLRIFSQEYSKPLPPLDWCFLQELVHESRTKDFSVAIAAHQVVLSGTARRFIVNYIEAITTDHTNNEDVLRIYSNLKYLGNSIQPITLKPFIEVTILKAVELFHNDTEEHLKAILKYVNCTMEDEKIQEANKTVVAQILSDVFNQTEIESKLFDWLLDSIVLFPAKFLDDISSPKKVKEVRADWFKRALRIRCFRALSSNETPLNWLNDLVEYGSSFPALTPFLFEQFAAVFEKHQRSTDCVLWFLDLIGQIQAVTADKSEEKEVLFLCNVLILATLAFSGHSVLIKDFPNCNDMCGYFPRAIATLLDVNHWSICTTQALEWFCHMSSDKNFNKKYRDMFVQCLQSLRYEGEFSKNMKWTKYMNVEC